MHCKSPVPCFSGNVGINQRIDQEMNSSVALVSPQTVVGGSVFCSLTQAVEMRGILATMEFAS